MAPRIRGLFFQLATLRPADTVFSQVIACTRKALIILNDISRDLPWQASDAFSMQGGLSLREHYLTRTQLRPLCLAS
jgi:hypothetical protein